MLTGSRARGDAYPTADYDFYALLQEGGQSNFVSFHREATWIDVHSHSMSAAKIRIEAAKPDLYGFVEGRILHDSAGRLAELKTLANTCLDAYRTPSEKKQKLLFWLDTAQLKLEASLAAQNEANTGFLVSTTTWTVLETLFALNNMPMPSSSAVKAYLPKLKRKPAQLTTRLESLYTGSVTERAHAMQTLIDFLLNY